MRQRRVITRFAVLGLTAAAVLVSPAHASAAVRECIGPVGVIPEFSLEKVGIPHHPGSSDVIGKLRAVVSTCPPRSGRVHLTLERYYFRKLGGHVLGWVALAGPVTRDLGGHEPGDVIVWPHLIHFCLKGRWRLHAWSRKDGTVAGDGTPRTVLECYPGGGGRCYKTAKGGLYIRDCS